MESENTDLSLSTRSPAKCMADWKCDCCFLCMWLLKAYVFWMKNSNGNLLRLALSFERGDAAF